MFELVVELRDETALADPGNAGDGDELRRRLATDAVERGQQQVAFAYAADERRHGTAHLDADARLRLGDFPDRYRLRLALRLDRRVLAIVDHVPGRAERRVPDEDAVRRRGALEARGRVHDVARDHALAELRPGVDVHERLAGVDRDAHFELAVLGDPVADRERRADGPLRIVLVRDRSAEDRHDCIADELLDGAAALLQLRPQPLVVRPQDRLDVLGIERLGARGEADEVGEQNRYGLALAPRAHRTRCVGYPCASIAAMTSSQCARLRVPTVSSTSVSATEICMPSR